MLVYNTEESMLTLIQQSIADQEYLEKRRAAKKDATMANEADNDISESDDNEIESNEDSGEPEDE